MAKRTNLVKYEDRVVAFLDILGWAELVKLSIGDNPEAISIRQKLAVSLEYIQERIEKTKRFPLGTNLQISQFSDSIAVSTNCISIISLYHFLETVSMIILDYITLGFPVRGGITRGLLSHDGSKLVGPAQIRAYELENQVAVYPRILVDDVVFNGEFNMTCENSHEYANMIKKQWRLDKDGCMTLDYLRPFITVDGHPMPKIWHSYYLEPAKKLIEKGLRAHPKTSKIYAKYKWLESYYNEILKVYGLNKQETEKFKIRLAETNTLLDPA